MSSSDSAEKAIQDFGQGIENAIKEIQKYFEQMQAQKQAAAQAQQQQEMLEALQQISEQTRQLTEQNEQLKQQNEAVMKQLEEAKMTQAELAPDNETTAADISPHKLSEKESEKKELSEDNLSLSKEDGLDLDGDKFGLDEEEELDLSQEEGLDLGGDKKQSTGDATGMKNAETQRGLSQSQGLGQSAGGVGTGAT